MNKKQKYQRINFQENIGQEKQPFIQKRSAFKKLTLKKVLIGVVILLLVVVVIVIVVLESKSGNQNVQGNNEGKDSSNSNVNSNVEELGKSDLPDCVFNTDYFLNVQKYDEMKQEIYEQLDNADCNINLYKIWNIWKDKYKDSDPYYREQDKNWERGFNNIWLDKEHYDIPAKCKLVQYWFPNYDVFHKFFVFPLWKRMKLNHLSCEEQQKDQPYLINDQRYNSNPEETNYVVFPEDFSSMSRDVYTMINSQCLLIQNWVLERTKFYKNKEDFKADYWLDFSDRNNPKLQIDIQEKDLGRDTSQAQGKMNVLLLFLDTISREQFFRSFPKTAAYLEKYYDPEQNTNLTSIGFQAFRAQGYTGYSWENIIDMRYGQP